MIKNLPTVNDDLIVKLRKASEDRGLWYYYLLKTARDKGYDIENFARKGVRAVGRSNRPKYPDTDNLEIFVKAFMDDINKNLFEMELTSMKDGEAHIDFHYCPMCGAWTQLTDDQEFIEKICDIAMEVDRGLFDTYDCFEFSLGKTICQGHETCEICIKKK
ncbi:MAG: L-2-amino-thiazoline-4-carboxylic acid hydrolase [Spirochaetales bacterium]|jgi:predicted ArsR family transcriptional regulator|nr:L-2-amino-thiazoline-4-carboxylic acid hydrolase [Spirochaetales bacterium]